MLKLRAYDERFSASKTHIEVDSSRGLYMLHSEAVTLKVDTQIDSGYTSLIIS